MKENLRINMNTPVFRVSYPSLFEMSEYNGKWSYSVMCITPKDWNDPDHPDPKGNNEKQMVKLRKAVEETGSKFFGKNWGSVKKRQFATPIRNGEEKESDGYGPDKEFFRLKNIRDRPHVVDKRNVPIDENDIYPGCYAIASISVYAYDTNGNKGVSFALRNVQKVADGDSFLNRTTPEDDFEAWDDDDDAADVLD